MGKRETGYARVERDLYPTPHWVVSALAEHVDLRGLTVWEPACGDGRMAEASKENSAWFLWERSPLLIPRQPVILYAPATFATRKRATYPDDNQMTCNPNLA
jgi:hypothetical protein